MTKIKLTFTALAFLAAPHMASAFSIKNFSDETKTVIVERNVGSQEIIELAPDSIRHLNGVATIRLKTPDEEVTAEDGSILKIGGLHSHGRGIAVVRQDRLIIWPDGQLTRQFRSISSRGGGGR